MPKYNRKCFNCGREYYCCSACVSMNSWKNTYCSTDCFLESVRNKDKNIKPIIIDKGERNVSILKAALKKNGRTIDITGYDLDLGRFDCTDDTTKVTDDFEYFIVPASEMKNFTIKTKSTKKSSTKKEETKEVVESKVEETKEEN